MFWAYLEEDEDLIRKHFPGAEPVALRTPFDLTDSPATPRLQAGEAYRQPETSQRPWYGDLLWNLPE